MKPFNLEKALAGEPVLLRNGSQGYVKYQLPDYYKGNYPLRGYSLSSQTYATNINWGVEGNYSSSSNNHDLDIIGMWEEPRPRVTLTLPCPLKEPQEGMHYILRGEAYPCCYNKNVHDAWMTANRIDFDNGLYFASKKDAKEWLDAMRNARR